MDANPQRGEVALVINGQSRVMCLTLGALAGLEARLETGSLMDLAERFENGRIGSAELIALLAAGLNGAGNEITEEQLSGADISGGPVAAMHAGMELLSRTFRPYQDGA